MNMIANLDLMSATIHAHAPKIRAWVLLKMSPWFMVIAMIYKPLLDMLKLIKTQMIILEQGIYTFVIVVEDLTLSIAYNSYSDISYILQVKTNSRFRSFAFIK